MLVVVVLGSVFTWVACSEPPPVASHPAGKAADDACDLCDLFDAFYDMEEEEDDGQVAGNEAEDDSTLADDETDGMPSDDETDSTLPEVVSFTDYNLERAVRQALKKPEGPLTTDDLASLTSLDVEEQNIKSLDGLEHATALDTLNLLGNEIEDVSPLSDLSNLTFLRLGGNRVADVSALSSLTKLKWLSLWGNRVADVSALSSLTDLNTLNLSGNEIEDVNSLSNLTKLRWLNLGNNQVADVSALDGLTKLDWLGLLDNPISQREVNEQVPTLIEKDVSVSVVRSQSQLAVGSFADANLERTVRQALNRPDGPLTANDLASLTQLTAVEKNIKSLAGLEHCTALEILFLGDNAITDVSPLLGLTNLTKLGLGENDLTDADVISLSSLTNLRGLGLASTGITDVGVSSLSSLTNLEEILLGGTGITDVSPLLSLTNLEELDLRNCDSLSDASLNTHIPALQARGVTVSL